jgi:hypothetical protein
MMPQRKGKNYQRATKLDTHRAYIVAVATAKGECDKVLDLLVDEMREEGLNQLAETFRVVLDGSRRADALWQWAVLEAVKRGKVPQGKIDELHGIQLGLATYFIQKPR